MIFLPNHYTEVPSQIRQARKLGIQSLFLGSDSWGTAQILKSCGKDCDGSFFSTHFSADMTTPSAKAFVETYRKTYGAMPDDVAALTYDSFGLIWQALRTAGRLDRLAVRTPWQESLSTRESRGSWSSAKVPGIRSRAPSS